MSRSLITFVAFLCVLSGYSQTTAIKHPDIQNDSLVISAISVDHLVLLVPAGMLSKLYAPETLAHEKNIDYIKFALPSWPATYEQFRQEFMKVKVEDPLANLDLHLPSPEELRNYAYPNGGIVMPGPISLLYNEFSKEAKAKKLYGELMTREKAEKRYNKAVVARVTGLKNEDDIKKFMEFCALQIKFILESSDYELYAAILDCYAEFCKSGFVPQKEDD
jgi:hypothetical protein